MLTTTILQTYFGLAAVVGIIRVTGAEALASINGTVFPAR
jgi:hypothetical protein